MTRFRNDLELGARNGLCQFLSERHRCEGVVLGCNDKRRRSHLFEETSSIVLPREL